MHASASKHACGATAATTGAFSLACARRIYCRPVYPVRPAQGRNVAFCPTAAAAEAAGIRPCLRCRPETAPFSPAWQGSRATVHRAMRLILDGARDRAGLDDLAARHRLFQKHIGVSSLQVARTVRVQRAKHLLDRISLPMTEIAASTRYSPKSTGGRPAPSAV